MVKKYYSPNALNQYMKCPRRFYYYIYEYPALPPAPPFKEPLEFGRIVHEIIARYYELIPENMTPGEIINYLRRALNEKFPPFLAQYRERVEKQLKNFMKFETQRLSWHYNAKPVAVEKEFVRGKVHGIVDALFRKKSGGEEYLVVVDWKTGRNMEGFNNDINLQLNIYMYLTGAREAYAVFLEYNRIYPVSRTIDIEELIKTIESDRVFARMVGEWCETCPYQLHCFKENHLGKDWLRYSLWSLGVEEI